MLSTSCTSLTGITIPNGVTSLGDMVFSGCTSLGSLTIPGTVTSLGDYEFAQCGLTNIIISNGVIGIGTGAF